MLFTASEDRPSYVRSTVAPDAMSDRKADLFATYQYKHFLLGGGYGHIFAGEFLRKTTPGVGPAYLYLFHTYVF